MKKITRFILFVVLFYITERTHTQWIEQITGSKLTKYNVKFVNENTGWVTGTNSLILKTTNGGNNWIQMTGSATTNSSLNGISFINVNTGWVCASLGVIWKTTNGCATWDSLYTGNIGTLRDIQFVNSQTGWVVGRNNRAFRTTNGGLQWDSLSIINGGEVIKFSNFMTGWCGGSFTGSNQSIIYKTTNSGLNWIEQNLPVIFGFCGSLAVQNDSNVWATFGNKILHTTNGGTYVGVVAAGYNLPYEYNLNQNYPNPFNPATTIEFELPIEDNIKILVHDILGREVHKVIEERLKAGSYRFEFDGSVLSSGIYFYTMYYSKGKITKKMILNK